ncbi:SHOCT domain-containing protein [Rhodoferax sp. WC2427]|uniref:SHOCT domain-containing protein n=1 Tax=Rhodoferax sp. WC2427 TaxID=3234144 RepID=UPI003466E176
MRQLSPAGQQAVNEIAQRQGFSTNAVESMLESVINGNGSMAQFNHPEFGGGGQWMAGGMTMIGDMFNGYLKGRVDNLCGELARLISNQPDLLRSGSFQSQSQNGSTQYNGSNASYGSGDGNSLFAPAPPDWWGADLRFPNSTGGQNDMRYAYFAQAHRLAIDLGGQVTVYDTLDHSIGGVSQQSSGYAPQFSSQYGYVNLSQLPVVSINGMAPAPTPAPAPLQAPAFTGNNDSSYSNNNVGSANAGDVFASIEKLASLQAKGILTPQEFATKKAELLSRL